MHDIVHGVYLTLGKVTGEEEYDGESTDKMTQNSLNDGQEEKLAQRADEIVLIVEQVQAQYTMLEQEMRQLVEKGGLKDKRTTFSQTDLRQGDLNDMIEHYETIKGTIRS